VESLAIRATEFLGKLWLKLHAAQQIGEARVRAQRVVRCVHGYSLEFIHTNQLKHEF
jgi:hypothetical protein